MDTLYTSDMESMRRNSGAAADFLALLSSRPRLLILCHLSESGELSVGQLSERVGLSQSALSQHLARLRAEGLVSFRRQAQTLYYSLQDRRAERLLQVLHELFCDEKG